MKSENKIAVYTAIFGNYDTLREPEYRSDLLKQADFFCFTDNKKIKSDFYHIVYVSPKYDNNVLNARYYKIMSHLVLADYEFTIWHDGAFQITTNNILELIEKYLPANEYVATFKHPYRQCVYDEVVACIRRNKENVFDLFYHIFNYYRKGMPANFGLIESSMIIRKNRSSKVVEMNEKWWQELHAFSSRDQVSFSYIWWKFNLNINFIPGNNDENQYFLRFPHQTSTNKNSVFKKIINRRYLGPMYWLKEAVVMVVFSLKRERKK